MNVQIGVVWRSLFSYEIKINQRNAGRLWKMENCLENLPFRLHLFWWRFIYIWIGVSFIQDARYKYISLFICLHLTGQCGIIPNQFSYNSDIEISLRSLVVEILTNKVLNLNMKLNVSPHSKATSVMHCWFHFRFFVPSPLFTKYNMLSYAIIWIIMIV